MVLMVRPNILNCHFVVAEANSPSQVLCEYPLEDLDRGLKNNIVSLKLGWDVMPYVGFVGKYSHLQTIGEFSMQIPGDYVPLQRSRGFMGPQRGQRGPD